MTAELLDALAARSGLVCLVGAGGKKTTLYRLAAAHPGRVGITASVYIPPFPAGLAARRVIGETSELLSAVPAAAAAARVVAFARPSPKRARLAGIDPALAAAIHVAAGFDLTLIKADGARGRWLKAPDADEPPIPETATTVIPVVSARIIGEPLSERSVHHVDRVAEIIGIEGGAIITAEHVARLLSDVRGALKNAGNATVVPLINMVDDAERAASARRAAERALELSDRFERVVLAAMNRPEPLVAVVSR